MSLKKNTNIIKIRGARQHNLKNIDVEIPRYKFVVITGTSGSGKSSLAFNTIYAEGQRKYVESLSSYARQFLDQLEKPDVDSIEGLSPALAIEQRRSSLNPRSTVATSTEIYDYLRVLYSSVGVPHDPETGVVIKKMSIGDIVDKLLLLDDKTKIIILSPYQTNNETNLRAVIDRLKRNGFIRARVNNKIIQIDSENTELPKTKMQVCVRILTSEDDNYLIKQNEKAESLGIQNNKTINMFRRSIISVNGVTDQVQLNKLFEVLPAMDSRKIRMVINNLSPTITTRQNVACGSCGVESEREVPFSLGFFWPDL